MRSHEAESPGRRCIPRPCLRQALGVHIRDAGKPASEERLHDYVLDPPLAAFFVEGLGFHAACVVPVLVVHLDLDHVPPHLAVIVQFHHVVEHLHVPVEGETKVADPPLLFLPDEEVQHSDVHQAAPDDRHAAYAYPMDKVIVEIVHAALREGFLITGLGCFPAASVTVQEGRHLGCQEIALPRILGQSPAGCGL